MTLLDLTPRPAARPANDHLPVAIIGAGPVGLAAAAHLLRRGIDFVVLEAGDTVGAAVRSWGHTRLFSPWRHLVDPVAQALLEERGWTLERPDRAPTGAELVEGYLEPLAAVPGIAARLRLGVAVSDVARDGMDRTRTRGRAGAPFVVRTRDASGEVADATYRAVVDASGTYLTPNSLASNGLTLPGLADVADRVLPALPDVLGRDRDTFAGRHTTVVGAGHSAANTVLALAALARDVPGTRVTWAIRTATPDRVTASDEDGLPGRASLGARARRAVADGRVTLLDGFETVGARRDGDAVELVGRRGGDVVAHRTDLVVNATGFRPDLSPYREIRLDVDEVVEAPRRLAPLIDPNEHSCGTVEPHGYRELAHPEQGVFIVGMKAYGRAPTFLLKTGYEQVRSVVAWIAGDVAAAQAIELVLPATGVCSTDDGGCC
ncbi:FAD-dependent oxidoreductase [Demequina sp. SYSU T00192]|uniref:FAD-dependent oxidoreductase n=1 Tax=Demequina litoralis TaxID=3051660 RepID=A0ABT8G5L3_9MICO|nr:FAD-dependent oxidoreductase [Demequina sp. SYSU T00192]MDN4474430.1 FAD-dependent oxidoreductase [Demequina sp. SYSU T00192]